MEWVEHVLRLEALFILVSGRDEEEQNNQRTARARDGRATKR